MKTVFGYLKLQLILLAKIIKLTIIIIIIIIVIIIIHYCLKIIFVLNFDFKKPVAFHGTLKENTETFKFINYCIVSL